MYKNVKQYRFLRKCKVTCPGSRNIHNHCRNIKKKAAGPDLRCSGGMPAMDGVADDTDNQPGDPAEAAVSMGKITGAQAFRKEHCVAPSGEKYGRGAVT